MPAVANSTVAVTATRVRLVPARASKFVVIIQQVGTTTLALGGPDVTFATGYKLAGVPSPQTAPETYPTLAFGSTNTELWAVADTATTGSLNLWDET